MGPSALLSLPPQWVRKYDTFITKNVHQVSQIESALRSLTYIIPGRFRDAEIASETIHSGVQLLSLYHDLLLLRALSSPPSPPSSSQATDNGSSKQSPPPPPLHSPSLHSRYTRFWMQKSPLYRRLAVMLQVVEYTQLLCEMVAKRRGARRDGDERLRWRVVVVIEAVKALCRLLLLRITRSRVLVSPPLPERQPVPDAAAADAEEEEDDGAALAELMGEEDGHANGSAAGAGAKATVSKDGSWTMPRTGMTLPGLPHEGDISNYLLSRVLTADDIKPAPKLANRLRGAALAAEVLHILAPLAFAAALARSYGRRGGAAATPTPRYNGYSSSPIASSSTARSSRGSALAAWAPWLVGVGFEMAARQLRDRGLRTTALEREEWSKRAWGMGWWAMRGAAYEGVTRGVVEGVRARLPSFVGGILEDYEYLWENYYFSTSP